MNICYLPPFTFEPEKSIVLIIVFILLMEEIRRAPVEVVWSNYSDLTRPHPKWWFSKGNPLISGKSRLVKYYNLTRYCSLSPYLQGFIHVRWFSRQISSVTPVHLLRFEAWGFLALAPAIWMWCPLAPSQGRFGAGFCYEKI